jgi:uncharacterized repeat protein (TIGR03803 family)
VIYSFPDFSNPFPSLVEAKGGTLYGAAYGSGGTGLIYSLADKSRGWKYKTIHSFDISDGSGPSAALIEDPTSRTFYGVTAYGGFGFGTVFSLQRIGKIWTEILLYSFQNTGDGVDPNAPLMRDPTSGALYGTSYSGRAGQTICGAAFQLTPSGESWNFSTLYQFQGGSDGCSPDTQLVPGPKPGTLIGATYKGGTNDLGTVFELKFSKGVWKETVIHSFAGGNDGIPDDLVRSKDGTLYGVTEGGTVFQMKSKKSGWQYTVIYTFLGGTDGRIPIGIFLDEKTGTLFGSTIYGGSTDQGTVFKLVPNGESWTETILHEFAGGPTDGAHPQSRPILDSKRGVLYGTTVDGGSASAGAAYSIVP